MRSFDPLEIPMSGLKLIEASAGTGKTYSIALIFLRLLLERKLEIDQILVVTFTTAATEELRTRIRSRLCDAINHFENTVSAPNQDETLDEFLSALENRQEARTRLADALARMDEAAIYTIHGFCQRMLQDYAFESGTLFDIDFLETEQPLRNQIIEDFWRLRFYPSTKEEAAWAVSIWGNPDGLAKDLAGILSRSSVQCIPEVSADDVEKARERAANLFRNIRQNWQKYGGEVEEILRHDKCLSRSKKDGYHPDRVDLVLSWMNELLHDPPMVWILPSEVQLLRASVMRGKLIRKKIYPEHEFFDRFEMFYEAHDVFIRAARFHTLSEARNFLFSEMEQRKNDQAKMYFDDLLVRLDRALSERNALQLLQSIRSRFHAALIDEFQDTDPIQYSIVTKLFGTGPDKAMFMIGDPKQSIYSFRGADIFTYIKARRETPESDRFTMEINYRSTSAMVSAVNSLFKPKDSFVFKEDIIFQSVRPGENVDREPLQTDGQVSSPLQVMMMAANEVAAENASVIAKSRAEEVATRWSAHEIARLLNSGSQGKTMIGNRSLTGKDLAVLVRTHYEANLMQQALSSLNIASVYYSQDSIFTTDEAGQFCQLLSALLDMSDESRISNALITDLFGLSGTELYEQQSDETKRDSLMLEMQEYYDRWHKDGIMALFQKMLRNRQVVQRLTGQPGGERKLTNFLHLAELLQEASLVLDGMDSLLRWLTDQIHNPDTDKANQQLRLESDEELVRIITVHKAKGLEYPIVFLPYIWRTRSVKKDAVFSFHKPGTNRVLADLGTGDQNNFHLADRERLAEDLRLLYVAITRACHRCYFCWGRINGVETTPMAYLLHRRDEVVPSANELNEQQLMEDIHDQNRTTEHINFVPFPIEFNEKFSQVSSKEKVLGVKNFVGKIDTGWGITSYSQMVSSHDVSVAEPDSDLKNEEPEKADVTPSVFSFPRGAAAGNFLHGLLEQVDFAGIHDHELIQLVENQLERSGYGKGWASVVFEWLKDILMTKLNGKPNFCLANIMKENRIAEMGFYFSIHNFSLGEFNQILAGYSIPPIVSRSTFLKGLMKGYIDLVFRHDDRYYIADYKSNYLGSNYDDYLPEHLSNSIRDHRYDLQYLIYTVALHRYLKTRQEGYDYDRHFGGVYYLFLRGMKQDTGTANGVYFSLPSRDLIESLDNCFGYPEEH